MNHLVNPDESVGDAVVEHLCPQTLFALPGLPHGGHEVDGVARECVWRLTPHLLYDEGSFSNVERGRVVRDMVKYNFIYDIPPYFNQLIHQHSHLSKKRWADK